MKLDFGAKHPLIVAPMAGGPTTVELVAASSNAGALGSIGAAYMTAAQIESSADQVRAMTANPFAINLFVPHRVPKIESAQVAKAVEATKAFRARFGLAAPTLSPPFQLDFDQQFETVLKTQPAVFSFIFGIPSAEHLRAAKTAKIRTLGTATSLEEARALESVGVDAIVLQGFEAGGHRGLFSATERDPEIHSFDLLRLVRPLVKTPLVLAGGLMNRSDVELAFKNGADAVQMGTAFLACQEAGTSSPYRRTLARLPRVTKTTRAFSGRLARGIENEFMTELDRQPDAILPFPAQNSFTRDIRNACAKADQADALSLWCGTGTGELWQGSAQDLIRQLFTS